MNSPDAHRFPLGFTLIFETLFLRSVKSRVIEYVIVINEIATIEDTSPVLQILVKVPVIFQS